MDIERGWFYLADLNPRRGTEPGKTRPVLVIQTNLLNSVDHPSTIILPLTTQVQTEAFPLRVRVASNHSGFESESDVIIDQIRAIDNRRFYRGDTGELIKKIAPADDSLLREVEGCVSQVLDL